MDLRPAARWSACCGTTSGATRWRRRPPRCWSCSRAKVTSSGATLAQKWGQLQRLSMYSHRNARAKLRLLGQAKTFLAEGLGTLHLREALAEEAPTAAGGRRRQIRTPFSIFHS
jgi:hypothetical protein